MMKKISPALKYIIIDTYEDEFNAGIYENIVRDAIRADVFDELIDTLYNNDIKLPSPQLVAEALYENYNIGPLKDSQTINYLINKYQYMIFKTFAKK